MVAMCQTLDFNAEISVSIPWMEGGVGGNGPWRGGVFKWVYDILNLNFLGQKIYL